MTPSLAHKGGSGGKSDQLSRLFTYGFPIPLNTFQSSKSKNKGDKRQKHKSRLFYDPSLTPTGGSGGKFDLLSRLSTYGFLLPPNTFYGSKCNTEEDNRGVHMNFKFSDWYL